MFKRDVRLIYLKVCSIKIESLAYYKEDVVFAWFPRLASAFSDFERYNRYTVSSEDERLSSSIEFEDDIELSQYRLQGQFSKLSGHSRMRTSTSFGVGVTKGASSHCNAGRERIICIIYT